MSMTLDRRNFVGATALLAASPVLFARAATERRFVFIIQRGAADGLNTVVPHADPDYARARGALALEPGSVLALDGSFALHPSLVTVHGLYGAGQATFFQAVASPYRDRSHFDGQNMLETGGLAPHQLKDGWLNRLLGLLPGGGRTAVALSQAVPLALRGAIDVTTYAPSALPQADQDLLMRVEQLYANDAQLHALWSAALDAQDMAGNARGGGRRQDPAAMGRAAAGFLARADGPRIAMIETSGWDTHSGQAGRLASQLKALDRLIAGLQAGLGAAWGQTVVLVATEFGRTVAANGTGGTDHGTGAAALLLGGAVRGGRVIADWPGLKATDLHEGRDLKPTLGLDTLVPWVCAETFGVDPARVSAVLFPGSAFRMPASTLLKS
jgi:uncharacterized protein (DUF1501 family)